MTPRIVRATRDQAAALSGTARRSKAHWGYPEEWLEEWREDLTLTPEYVATAEVHVAFAGADVAGFYALDGSGDRLSIDHLWVEPRWIGRGVGRALALHALRRARERKARSVDVVSDPNAEPFYRHLGARAVGVVAAPVLGQPRELPRLRFDVGGVDDEKPRWSVYMVRCRDGSLYTGIATDVSRRLAEHQGDGGRGARFLRGKGPLKLVLEKPVGEKSLALQVERRIKSLPKRRKEALIGDERTIESLVERARAGPGVE